MRQHFNINLSHIIYQFTKVQYKMQFIGIWSYCEIAASYVKLNNLQGSICETRAGPNRPKLEGVWFL